CKTSSAVLHRVFVCCSGYHREPHSFPTRRSSDLGGGPAQRGTARDGAGQRAGVDGAAAVPQAAAGIHGAVSAGAPAAGGQQSPGDRKSTRLNSSHVKISYAVFCLKKKNHSSSESY